MKKVLRTIAAFVATAAIAATMAVSTSANDLVSVTGTICEGRRLVIYTVDAATDEVAFSTTRPDGVGVMMIAGPFTPAVGGWSEEALPVPVNEGSTAGLAGADPEGLAANAIVGFQMITAGAAIPAPSAFSFAANQATVRWVVCTCDQCDTAPPTSPDVTTGDTPTSPSVPSGDDSQPTGSDTVPTGTDVSETNPPTGVTSVALVIVPTLVAAGAAIATIKRKRK